MAEIDSAAFSVSVDNQAEIRDWLEGFSRLRDEVEHQFEELVRMAQNRPLIRLTIRYEGAHRDGADASTEHTQ